MRLLLNNSGHSFLSSLLSLIYPSECPVCKCSSDSFRYSPICLGCWHEIKRYNGPACKVCAAPLVSEYSSVCSGCLNKKPHFSVVMSFGLYSGTLREAIHLFKFSGLRRLAGPLGRFMSELPIPQADGIVPVPLSRKSLRVRGFNQTLLLARALAKHMELPVLMDVLLKRKETPPQIGLGAAERAANIRKAFEADPCIKGKKLVLLDDVMTTGATARECAKTLVKAGAEDVVVATLARSALT